MTYKKITLLFFVFSITCAISIGLFNYIIDPFQQYRRSTFYQAPYINPRYLIAGMAKNFSYDSLIIGTSMTENFHIREVSDMLSSSKPIKLTVGGGSIFDEATILKTAINTGKVKQVLFGLDIFCLRADPSAYPLPGYLYDNNTLNDYHYLFNLDTLKRSLTYPFFQLIFKHHPRMDYMRMFEWQFKTSPQQFSATKVMHAYQIARTRLALNFPPKISSYQYMKNNFDHLILPIIKQNSSIHFTIFFPPYSILEYKLLAESGHLENYLKVKTHISEQLLPLINVNLFDFQTEKTITHNLDNYMDTRHYHQRINHWMLKQMRAGHNRVTNPQRDETKLRNQTLNFTLPKNLKKSSHE